MPRQSITVRPMTALDTPALAALWEDVEAAQGGGVARPVAQGLERLRTTLEAGAPDPATRVFVACEGDDVVGLGVVSVGGATPWRDGPALLVNLLVVRSGLRHRGVGRALLRAAVAVADEVGAGDIAVDLPPGLRDAHRFYAKLGFTPLATRRTATVPVLRRRLSEQPVNRLADLRARASVRRRVLRAEMAPPPGR